MPTMRVTMSDPARSEDGLSMMLSGQTYTVSVEYGMYLIRTRGAVDTDRLNPFVSPANQLGRVIATISPNVTLNDTGGSAGNADTAFPVVITIPGGIAGPHSMFRLTSTFRFTGANAGRVVHQRIGAAATATFATATPIGGQSGLAAQVSAIYQTLICMAGTLTSQQCTPANGSSIGAGTNAWVATNLDFGLDVNIWHGIKFPTLAGGDTATFQKAVLELLA